MVKYLIIFISILANVSALNTGNTYIGKIQVHPENLKAETINTSESFRNQQQKIEELTNELENSNLIRNILFFSLIGIICISFLLFRIHNKKTSLGEKLKMQNSQLESVNKLFTNFLDQSIEAFTVFDAAGQIILWNKANENITGITQEECLGQYIWDIGAKVKMLSVSQNKESEIRKLKTFFSEMINNPGFDPQNEELMIEKKNGEIRTLMITYFPIKISKSYYFGIISWDITERKEYEGELIIAKELAEQSDKLKSEFLGQISHEIRTPINTIVNNISLLKYELEDSTSPAINESISSLSNAGERIIRTIDLLIDISAIHTGSFEIQPKQINLFEDIIKPCADKYHNEVKKKNIELIVNKQCNDLNILVDPHSINQIADNLISNAVTFTDEGKIEINVNKDMFRRLYFEVIDTGIGISEKFLSQIYKPFSQEEQGYTRKYEGNGLGLTLVKEYCELNDATVSVNSKKGEGTTFKVTFNKVDLKSILF